MHPVSCAPSESPSRPTAREPTAAAEPADAAPSPAASSSAPSSATTPAATSPLAHDPERDPEQTAARDDEQQDERNDDPGAGDLGPARFRRRPLVHGIGERDAELASERLGDQIHAEGQALAVLLLRELGHHGIPNPADARVGEESLRTAAGRDEDVARAGSMVLPRHEQYEDAKILRRVAGLTLRANAPLPSDLNGDVAGRPVADVRQRDDRDFAACLRAHLRNHRLHVPDRGGVQDAREVVHVSLRGRNADLEEKREADQRVRRESSSSRTWGSKGLMT